MEANKQTASEKTKSFFPPIFGARAPAANSRSKLLVSIVNRGDESRLKEILDECSVALAYRISGTGTAQSAVLDYFGIGETEKSVLISLFPESDEGLIIREIREKMSLYLVGRGISFTVPLGGISRLIANGLASAATNKVTDGSLIMTGGDRKYNLVIAAVAANFVDEAMEAARAAGATGGTVIRARAEKNEKSEQFIGISLMQEQEILLILARKEDTLAMMSALSSKVGAQTPAGGVIFCVPVDRTAGISVSEEEEIAVGSGKGKDVKK